VNVFWVGGGGNWSVAPTLIGPANFAPKGAPLAASQRFGVADQTDIFVVDNDGQLNEFSVVGGGNWSQAKKIGPTGQFPPKAHIAVSQQFGIADQTDVFVVDNDGQLNVFWVHGAGNWSQQPTPIGAKGLAKPGAPIAVTQHFGMNDRSDVFLVDKTGTLNMFWVVGAGAWNGPRSLGPVGLASSDAFVAASQHFGEADQTDVFLLSETGTNGPGWPTLMWVRRAGPWGGPVALVTEA
jgi:hypothetical protein